jgi:hypothetical protein
MTPPASLRVKELSMYMLNFSWVTEVGDYCISVHSTIKSARAWDLITVCGT